MNARIGHLFTQDEDDIVHFKQATRLMPHCAPKESRPTEITQLFTGSARDDALFLEFFDPSRTCLEIVRFSFFHSQVQDIYSLMSSSSDSEAEASSASSSSSVIGEKIDPVKKKQQDEDEQEDEQEEEGESQATFASLGVHPQICQAIDALKWKKPTAIQQKCIPLALQGKDVIGLAETGSGKTAAFAIPILQALWDDPRPLFACVLAPTRELALQITEQFELLGSTIGVRCATILGGVEMMPQAIALAKKPHIVVASPGRLQDHLESTKGFNLRSIKYLVMDEADRLLSKDFGPIITKLIESFPRDRKTMLFSATMSSDVNGFLRDFHLTKAERVEAATKYSTVSTLSQYYVFIPVEKKDTYLVSIANEQLGKSMIIFTRTVHETSRLAILLRMLGFSAIPIHGKMDQSARVGALGKFKGGGRNILVATDLASRGWDIPAVDLIINYDMPLCTPDYIHRVGRTARAGRSGIAVTITTQYDVELIQRIEFKIKRKLTLYPGCDKDSVRLLEERVGDAARRAIKEMADTGGKGRGADMGVQTSYRKRRGDDMDRDDDGIEAGMSRRGGGRGSSRGRGGRQSGRRG